MMNQPITTYLATTEAHLVGVVVLAERLDASSSASLQNAFAKLSGRGASNIVFDCSRLDFLDSSGLGAIVSCLRKSIELKGDVRLAALGDKVRMLFELTKAKKLFSIFPDAESAIGSFCASNSEQP